MLTFNLGVSVGFTLVGIREYTRSFCFCPSNICPLAVLEIMPVTGNLGFFNLSRCFLCVIGTGPTIGRIEFGPVGSSRSTIDPHQIDPDWSKLVRNGRDHDWDFDHFGVSSLSCASSLRTFTNLGSPLESILLIAF